MQGKDDGLGSQSTESCGARAPRIPVSTYRLQLHRGFRFLDALSIVPYLSELGVTDCYASPYLKANPGSTHGYDICDHNQINPDIGTEADYAAFTAALATHGMGQILDFVPNHMGADAATNRWWRDVLENGRCSPYADFFDIDWEPVKLELKEKVLLPILGAQYGFELERGALRLVFEHGTFALRYFDHDLPVSPRQIPSILEYDLATLRDELGEENPQFPEYLSIATALRNLPAETETDRERVAERHREKEVARERLQRLMGSSRRIREHIDSILCAYNGEVGKADSFDRLHTLLEAQAYRLSYWRTASHEINYRCFFDINELAGLRMDDSQVFANTHALLLRLISAGQVTGLRLDHIDGLFDPQQYLEWLQQATAYQLSPAAAPAPADGGAAAHLAATKPTPQSLYIVTEKILSAGESLSDHWPVAGTSGYDFLNDLNGLFVDPRGQPALLRVYRRFTAVRTSFADIAYASKKLIMNTPMASELNVLARALNRLSERDRRTRDFTLNSLRDGLREVAACFPIYRTYISAKGWTEADRGAIDTAIHRARRRNSTMEPSIFDFVRNALLPDPGAARSADELQQRLAFAMKFQQYTGPVQAKGLEDTAFYRYIPLLSLSEVGGDPDRFGSPPAQFPAANARRRRVWPFTMLASATHDTKRGEDVRARLNVLSELPEEWGRHLSVWARINGSNRTVIDGEPAPDRNDEYLFYQTLLGVWPPGLTFGPQKADDTLVTRLQAYMLKAVREAKVHTSWIAENRAYEAAVLRFVERALCGATAPRFLAAFLPFQARIAQLGMLNALSQLVLKVVSPGVPDFYQGSELWDLNLVDPDNRRPVDFAVRRRLFTDLQPFLSPSSNDVANHCGVVREMLDHWQDGRIKLFMTAITLRLRRQRAALFRTGTYEPLDARGERADHVVALCRRHQHDAVVAVVPRLSTPLTTPAHPLPVGADSWGATRILLPPEFSAKVLQNAITGEVLRPDVADCRVGLALGAALETCPVAVLVATLRTSTNACGCN